KSGIGTLELAGATNAWTGTTTITGATGGVLRITGGWAPTGAITVGNATSLELSGTKTLTLGANVLTLNDRGYVGNLTGSGKNTGALHLLPNANVTITSTAGTGVLLNT